MSSASARDDANASARDLGPIDDGGYGKPYRSFQHSLHRAPSRPSKTRRRGVSLAVRSCRTDDNASRHGRGFADGSEPRAVRGCGIRVSSGSADEREDDFPLRPRAVQRREPGSNHRRATQVNPRYRSRLEQSRITPHVTAHSAGRYSGRE